MNSKLHDRVERERAAHEEADDVLTRAYELKERFSHVTQTPAHNYMESLQSQLISTMKGAKVLDYGCGMGEMAMKYIDGGARQVVGIDISEKYVRDAERQLTGLAINRELFEFRVMDAHELHFSDNTFDFVIGRGILHHLDLDTAIREIHRVLKPGGRASFLEPLADNPLLRIFRALTPRARTEDERPLSSRELMIIAQHFQCSNYFFGSISAPVAVLTSLIIPSRPDNFLSKLAHAAEEILRKRRILESWNQYVLLNLKRIV